MLATNDFLSNPFSLLAAVVRDYHLDGRRALGATLKPDLYRRFRLTEQQLGYARFGDFLRAAERAGFVKVIMTLGGDLEVFPPDVAAAPAQQKMFVDSSARQTLPARSILQQPVHRDDAPIRVRVDLWTAFTSFSSRWVYDPIRDRAIRVLADQSVPPILGGGQPIPIPSGRERTLGWMRTFAEMQDPETKTRLLAVLNDGETTPYQFNSTIRSSMKMLKAWQKYHVRQVVAAIETWAASNNLKLKDVTLPFLRQPQPRWSVPSVPAHVEVTRTVEASAPSVPVLSAVPLTAGSVAAVAAQSLTPRLAVLVDELIDELLRLRGALQVIDPKR
jgi:hypothetical protein